VAGCCVCVYEDPLASQEGLCPRGLVSEFNSGPVLPSVSVSREMLIRFEFLG